ncbi:RNA polymerase sigma factor [Novosphingobium sp. 1949]|uniref:RNA polymerase sigma factor n=1 Tax=Novosphingobium organovorum TaxID=2930092 RepID=A0ABT0BJF0_9SPHN|nr:RNA polymerase sigma factor [Novosphingobium organovorum]
MAEALAGRASGHRTLMRLHREAIYRFVHSYTGHEADALDVTQECFVAAFLALARYDAQRPFRGWLLRIALNKCHDWARRRTVRRLFTFAAPLDEAAALADTGTPDPEAALLSRQEVARIEAAIAALPGTLKDPLLLCTLEGLSQDAAAQVLGISRKAVETRIYRARQKLSQRLEG